MTEDDLMSRYQREYTELMKIAEGLLPQAPTTPTAQVAGYYPWEFSYLRASGGTGTRVVKNGE